GTVGQVGDVVTYSFLVTNTGTTTISSLVIVDPMLTVTCPSASLAATAAETCTQDYTVVQADLDAGSIVNTAHVTGSAPGATAVTSADSTATVNVVQNAQLTLTETADASKVTAVGQVVHYTFNAVNTGNLTLTNVTVTPGAFTGTGPVPTIVCPAAPITLIPGADVTCTASYTATAADLQLATLNLDAGAAGSANGAAVAADPATTQIPVVAPAVSAILAQTGVAGLQSAIGLAAGLLALGVVLLVLRRRRRI
ncbi:MAG TPA: LPXTG cell wall anchor domain-containing protein, partial [Pseudolysinimonas sp.]